MARAERFERLRVEMGMPEMAAAGISGYLSGLGLRRKGK